MTTTNGVLRFGSLLAVLAGIGCGSEVGETKQGEIKGTVLKGPVSGSTVIAFDVDDAGHRGDELGRATTDESGSFAVDVGKHAGAVLVCSSGGVYEEESTGNLVQPGSLELCRLVDDAPAGAVVDGVLVTPWTTIHAELAACFIGFGRDSSVTDASQHAALRLNDFLSAGVDGFDFRSTVPADVTTASGLSLSAEAWAGVLHAGLSATATAVSTANDVAPGVRFTAMTLTDALRRDIAGGCVFDGLGAGGTSIVEGDYLLTADTLRGAPQGLASSIAAFLSSSRNTSGITSDDVQDVLRRLAGHESEIFGGATSQTDLDKPVLTFIEPAANATRGGVVRVEVTGVDASEIETFAFTAPAQATFTAVTPTCTTDDTGTTCRLIGNLNTSLAPIVDGPVTISVTATDAAGNTQTADHAFTANNSLPVITVTAPAADAVLSGPRTITATAADADGITSLSVDIPGVGLCSSEPGADVVDIEPATGALSCLWDTTRSPEGRATLTFRAVDGAGQTADLPHVVTVDNNAFSTINGFVDVGSPVVAATVTALDWSGRVRGAVLGTTTTSDTGAFSVTLDDTDHPSVLLVVTGGAFVDLATGGTFAIADGQELTSAVAAINAGDVKAVNVNAWTTLAAARATHTPAVADDAFVITTNVNLLSQHLRRVPLAPFSVATTRSADLTTEVVTISDQRAVLALSHAALSRLAAETSVAAGVAVGSVTAVELVRVLATDLASDPLLDGVAVGSALTFGPANAPVTSLTTRFEMAAALDRWLAEVPLQGANVDRNNSSITRTDALFGRLFEALAEDNRGDLYPDAGRPFDVDAPTIDLSFGGVHQGAVDGASLRGSVQVNGAADDEAGDVLVFGATLTADGTFLPDDDASDGRLRVFVGTNVLPNSTEAAESCINAPGALEAAELDDTVCVCAIAEDEQQNVAESILCFTRPVPAVAFTAPSPSNGSAVTGATTIAAQVTTGFDLASFEVVGAASSLVTTRPTADTLQVTVPTSFVDTAHNPDIVVELRATDIAGRTTPATLTFTRPAPVVGFEPPSPAAGSSVTGAATVVARVTSGYDVASFTIGGSTSTLPVTRPTSDTIQVVVPTSFVDSANKPNIVVDVTATDVAGRIAPASLTFTRAAPTTSIAAPTAGAVFITGQQVQLTGAATGGYDLATCAATLTSSPVRAAPALPAIVRSGTSCSFAATLATTAIPDATWTLTMAATDVAGRVAPLTTRTFIVDDTAPVLSSLTLTGVTRPINTIAGANGGKFIGADSPTAPLPRVSTYTAAVTATDNFAISRVVFRVDPVADGGPDLLFCVEGVAGACSSPTAVNLRPCDGANNCTIGGTKVGDVYTATIPDARVDGDRTISAVAFDVNGNDRTDGASVVLNKDSVAPVFTWKTAAQQNTWHNMAPTAEIVPCRTVDSGTDFRSSCVPKPAATPVDQTAFVPNAFFVGSTPTTPTATMFVWRNLIRSSQFVTTTLPTATADTVGDGTVSVKFQAGTTCPTASTLTQSKGLTGGGFKLGLAAEDLGFDMRTVHNARVCVRAVPVDGAGNEGAPADLFVRWDTVDPPLNVLVNPPDDADALPALAFSAASTDARSFLTGGKQVSVLHAYVSNPYTFATKVKLERLAGLEVDVGDTLSMHTSEATNRTTIPSTNAANGTPRLTSPGASNPLAQPTVSWNTSGLAASDGNKSNSVRVRVTSGPNVPYALNATKVDDSLITTGVRTITNPQQPNGLDRDIVFDAQVRWFAVSSTGAIGAEITPDAQGYAAVPAATSSGIGVGATTTASVVVAVLTGKVASGTTYAIAAPTEPIAVPRLRDGLSYGIAPEITTTRFVVTKHPILTGSLLGPTDVEGETGFFVHATNGTADNFSARLLCGTTASNASCRFYKRWFELEELRLALTVGDGTNLKKLFQLSTREANNTINTFNASSALVEPHPFWVGLEGEEQILRVSDAP